MAEQPNELTHRTDRSTVGEQLVANLRLTGGLFLDATFRGRFAIASHFEPAQCSLFFPIVGALVAYHYVYAGELLVSVEGMAPVRAERGSIILFPRNDPHLLFNAEVPPVPSQNLITHVEPPEIIRIDSGEGEPAAQLYCGFMSTDSTEDPLLARLPRMLVMDPTDDLQSQWLESSLRMAALSPNTMSADAVGRLAELMVRETLRQKVRRIAETQPWWFDGLQDLYVARALGMIHRRYAEPLTLDLLAREAGLSRSGLAERFSRLIGESPMRYHARWRLREASRRLRESNQSIAAIADAVGFSAEASFSRAFKREFGEAPAAWRRRKEIIPNSRKS